MGDWVSKAVGSGPGRNRREKLMEVVEVTRKGEREGDVGFVPIDLEAVGSCTDGTGHRDDEVWDGSGMGVEEAEAPLGDGYVGYEHGSGRNGRRVGETGQEIRCKIVNAFCKRAVPTVPFLRVHLEVWGFVHRTVCKETEDGLLVGEGVKEGGDLLFNLVKSICKEGFGEGFGANWLARDTQTGGDFNRGSGLGFGRGGGWLVGEGGDGVLNFVGKGVSVMLSDGRDGRGTVGGGEDACFDCVEEEAEGGGAFLEFAEEEKCIFEVD
eukprot:scaffold30304_cov40-Cyclotella_meneghiniana.AAC.1